MSTQKYISLTPETNISKIDLTSTSWTLPELYKDNRFWTIYWNANESRLYSNHGTINGKIQIDNLEVIPRGGKTLGEQAFQEAVHRYSLKLKEGLHQEDIATTYDPEPMLAKTYLPVLELEERKRKGDKKKATDVIIDTFPVMVQSKLDGVRILAKRMPDNRIRLRSRRNNEFPFLADIKNEVIHLLDLLPPGTEIDGEGYTEDLPFEKITGIARKTKMPDPNENKLRYFIFDIILPENQPFEIRYQILQDIFDKANKKYSLPHLCLVLSHIAHSDDEILRYHQEFIGLGYEGTMIRVISNGSKQNSKQYENSLYQGDKRSNGLLKYKNFYDTEMEIVDVLDGSGSERGVAMFKVKNPFGSGSSEFVIVRPRSSFELRQKWFKNPTKIIGKMYTVRYQEITPDGNLRFPIGIAIRDYE